LVTVDGPNGHAYPYGHGDHSIVILSGWKAGDLEIRNSGKEERGELAVFLFGENAGLTTS
jgi:hypothetical protein